MPGESSAIDLTFDATATDEGIYSAQMTLSHNDPDVSAINIPVEMTVVDDNYPVFSSSETAEAVEDVFFVYHAIAEDPEGLEVTYEFLNYPDWLTADADSIYGTPLEGTGDFSFSVTANDGYLTSEITVSVDFESVPDTPNPFNIIYPSPGLEIATLNVVFQWEEAIDPDEGDIVSYTLYYGETISDLQIIDLDDALSYAPQEELIDNTTYYWKVVATDLLGLTSESNGGYQSFMVNTENDLPGDFALLSPENASMVTDLTPTMMWEEPLDADDVMTSIGGAFGHRAFNGANTLATNTTDEVVSYDVYLSTDDLFTDVTAITVQTNSYTPDTDLAEDMMYYWKVVATDDDGGQTESSVFSFWTNSENSVPTAITLLTPAVDEVTGLTPTFSWTESNDVDLNDAVSYTLYYGSEVEALIEVATGSLLSHTPDTDLMDNTEYYWQVMATDLSGATYTTDLQSFMVNTENDLPGDFALLSPENASMVTDLTPTMMWEEPLDADDVMTSIGGAFGHRAFNGANTLATNTTDEVVSYDVYLSTDDLFTDVTAITVQTNSYTPDTDLAEDMMYYWKVVATDDDGGQTESSVFSFWTNSENSVPTAITLLTPAVDEVTGLTPTFSWTESNDADLNDAVSYTLYYGSEVEALIEVATGSLLSHTPDTDLMDNTEYYWQVMATDLSGATYTTDLQSFMVNTENDLPGDFALLSPENASMVTDLTPTMMWEEPLDADDVMTSIGGAFGHRAFNGANTLATNTTDEVVSYDVYLSTDDLFTDVTAITVQTNSYTPDTDLAEDMMYYWKVVATDDDGGQTESSVFSFWTNSENSVPTAITLLTPAVDEVTGLTPTFSWTESNDADLNDAVSYTLYYGSEVEALIEVATGSLLSHTPDTDLMDNTEYYWQVMATDLSGATYTTDLQSFMVNTENDLPGDFALLSPENASMVTDLTPTMMWEEPLDADDVMTSIGGAFGHRAFNGANTLATNTTDEVVSYDVYLSTDDLFTDVTAITVQTNSYTPDTDLAEDMMYYWKVVATDDDGGQTESSVFSFWTNSENSVPTAITLLTPAVDEVTGLTPTFSWTESNDADLNDAVSYTLYYGSEVEALIEVATGSLLSHTPDTDLMDNTEYYWQVMATDLSGATYTTDLQSFMVNTENDNPDQFTLVSPENGITIFNTSPLLVWSLTTDLDGDNINFNVYLNGENIGTTDHNYMHTSDLMLNMTYEWYVVAFDDNGGVSETTPWAFTISSPGDINYPPGPFSLLSPAPESLIESTSVNFEWEESVDDDPNGQVVYRLEIHTDSSLIHL